MSAGRQPIGQALEAVEGLTVKGFPSGAQGAGAASPGFCGYSELRAVAHAQEQEFAGPAGIAPPLLARGKGLVGVRAPHLLERMFQNVAQPVLRPDEKVAGKHVAVVLHHQIAVAGIAAVAVNGHLVDQLGQHGFEQTDRNGADVVPVPVFENSHQKFAPLPAGNRVIPKRLVVVIFHAGNN